MSFKPEAYRVLIASPSDLTEERQAAGDAINSWNAQHAVSESAILLPVMWETHARPQAGARPQKSLNRQLVHQCDILVGMFWTRMGTDTGVAESGTVEEIGEFVRKGKPTLLYFSRRAIDPNRIDLKQFGKLKRFKDSTYKNALTGTFRTIEDLQQTLQRHLLQQIHALKKDSPPKKGSKLDQAFKLTELMTLHRRHKIAADDYQRFRQEILGAKPRTVVQTTDPAPPREVGPNGHTVGYNEAGDKVEWMPDENHPGKECPIVLRRNDKAILAARTEFFDKVWWNQHNDLIPVPDHIKLTKAQKSFLAFVKKRLKWVERKYGKTNLDCQGYEWGLLSGRLSALSWVMGANWDESLDT